MSKRNRAEERIRRALKGGLGFADQQEAWDAVLPSWRDDLDLVLSIPGSAPLTADQQAHLHRLTEALNAENRRLAGPWGKLVFQTICRRHDESPNTPKSSRWGCYPL